MTPGELASALKEKARQLGFSLAGISSPQAPTHMEHYRRWIEAGRQAEMAYLADEQAVAKRAYPRLVLPECRSILVLATPYHNPNHAQPPENAQPGPSGRVAAYAWGQDYHLVLPERLRALVTFLEQLTGQAIPNRWYTDTGPVMERDLAVQAGLGWIGKNTCLINPQAGSFFLLAEILLGIELPADAPFESDQCGTCQRCIEACPTDCILPDRSLDARRCISYLTIENKLDIPQDLRPLMGNWVFGCDVCQMVCPWNLRFAQPEGDAAFAPQPGRAYPELAVALTEARESFNQRYKNSPLKRAKWRGFQRNAAVAAGNSAADELGPALLKTLASGEPLAASHAAWALERLAEKKA